MNGGALTIRGLEATTELDDTVIRNGQSNPVTSYPADK
jgi:hypothetical protein